MLEVLNGSLMGYFGEQPKAKQCSVHIQAFKSAIAGGNGQGRQASHRAASSSGRGFLLELHDIKFGYDDKRPVLKGVTLRVERGQVSLFVPHFC